MKRDKNIIKSFKINKKTGCALGGFIIVCFITTTIVFYQKNSGKEETVTYRETMVEHGNLTVGISESATVSIGTVEQKFELDINSFVENDSSSTSAQTSGFSAMSIEGTGSSMMAFSFGGNTVGTQSQEMTVEEIHITVGQKISEGDILYTLKQESVDEIRLQLEEDIEDTLSDYNVLQVEQKKAQTDAKQGYDTYVMNGSLAQTVYDQTIYELQKTVDDANDNIEDIQNQINDNLEKLVTLERELKTAQEDLADAENAAADMYESRFKAPYYYVTYENTRETAKNLAETLEEKKESLQEENEKLVSDLAEALRSLNQANRDLQKGKLEAQQTMETDNYYAAAALEWYDIQTTSLEHETQAAKDSYDLAVSKLEEFNSYIAGNDVIAEYNGVITDVPLDAGDGMTMNTVLVSLYDQEAVTVEVSLVEDDLEAIDQEGKINIVFTAYPDEIYAGVISEISDAQYDSDSGSLYYTVTVTLLGDVTGLFEGMTGDVTFVTRESQEVTYVSNRAIFRDGTRSYVKVKDTSGRIIEKEVVTGFSDGINVEIIEGLSAGDVVLIESKVKEA